MAVERLHGIGGPSLIIEPASAERDPSPTVTGKATFTIVTTWWIVLAFLVSVAIWPDLRALSRCLGCGARSSQGAAVRVSLVKSQIPNPKSSGGGLGGGLTGTIGTVSGGVQAAGSGIDPNKLNHIFNNLEHGLQGRVKALGSQAAAYQALQQATQAAVSAQRLSGLYTVVVNVGGLNVTVTGNAVNGVARIGTAYIQSEQMSGQSALTPLESSVMEMFLRGDHPSLETLRRQLAASHTARREFTGVGFFTYFDVPSGSERAHLPGRIVLNDVSATVEGLEHGAGFVLFVVDGLLQMLEGFTFDETWPAEILEFKVQYHKTPRDLSML